MEKPQYILKTPKKVLQNAITKSTGRGKWLTTYIVLTDREKKKVKFIILMALAISHFTIFRMPH